MAMPRSIAVVGAGLMGHALALDFALRDRSVRITDADPARLADVAERVRRALQPFLAAGLLDAESATAVAARIAPTRDLAEAVGGADYLVEAIPEQLDLKRELYARLEALVTPTTIFASNTSGLRATDLAAGLDHPERLIVAHYFNPPYLIPAVEIVPGEQTAQETTDATCDLLRSIGKQPVVLKREAPGFIANRLQAALLREAIHLVTSGAATPEDIDTIMAGAVGRRLTTMGPFQVLDFAGVDVWAQIGAYLFADLDCGDGAQRFLERLVEAGRPGVKAGVGVYAWTPEAQAALAAERDRELLHCLQRAGSETTQGEQ